MAIFFPVTIGSISKSSIHGTEIKLLILIYWRKFRFQFIFSSFHKQILESWVKFNHFTPSNDVVVLNEYIFNSNLFLCENKVLKPNSFGLANTNDNYDIKLIDLLDSATGKTLDIATLNQKMNWNLNFL